MSKLPVSFGMWLQIGHPIVAEIAAYHKFDWVCVDLEHSPTSLETMANMFRAMKAINKNIMSTVRVPNHGPKTIARCLDAGAECLIIPQVNTVYQALQIVQAAKYPPEGQRGCGYSRSNQYGTRPMVNTCKIIVQIEHHLAMDHLDPMMQVPGIDGAFIGPLDLIGSLPSRKNITGQMMAIRERFIRIISRYKNKYIGLHIVEPTQTEIFNVKRQGYNFIALGVDTSLLANKMKSLL